MPDWHPAQTLVAVEWILPRPGNSKPCAVIRWLLVTLNGKRVWRFRVVTFEEPRELLGYFVTLEEAALRGYTHGLRQMQPSSDFGMYNEKSAPSLPKE